jgi:ABC-type cobalamin transport system ATPase subunit
VTSGPFADPTSTAPGQTWDTVTATLTQEDQHHAPGQPLAVTGPDGNGTVTVAIDTNGLAPGTYTVRISGLVLTQTATFTVQKDRSTTW